MGQVLVTPQQTEKVRVEAALTQSWIQLAVTGETSVDVIVEPVFTLVQAVPTLTVLCELPWKQDVCREIFVCFFVAILQLGGFCIYRT